MKLYPIIRLTQKWGFEYNYLQKIGFKVQTTGLEPAYIIDGEKVNDYTYFLEPKEYKSIEELEAVQNFFEEYFSSFNQLKKYEYTKKLSFAFDCIDDYDTISTIEKSTKLEAIQNELGIDVIVNKINPELLESDLTIEVNWKENNLSKRHYAEEVLNDVLESKNMGYCQGGEIALGDFPDMSVFLTIKEDMKNEAIEIINQALSSDKRLGEYKLIMNE